MQPDERRWTIRSRPRWSSYECDFVCDGPDLAEGTDVEVVPAFLVAALQGEVERLRCGLAERGYVAGRNPDGVDDTVPTALLVIDDLQARVRELEAVAAALLPSKGDDTDG